jgi:hypothetical protein
MRAKDDFPDSQDCGDSESDSRHFARQIDRLVTGDLDDADRMVLLRWLDAEPPRWRRCALAFLEAQVIRESLAECSEKPAPALGAHGTIDVSPATQRRAGDGDSDSKAPSSPPRARTNPPRRAAVAAAALLLAFTLGWAGGKSWPAANVAVSPGPTGGDTLAERHSQKQADPTAPPSPSPFTASFAPDASHRTPVVRIRTGDGPDARQIILPVAEKPALQDVAAAARQVIPDYVRAQWERQGYRVVEDRRLMPLKLADGRNVVMPVSRVTLNYVGRPSL